MNIKSFIAVFKSKKTADDKKEFLSQYVVNTYIPFEKKIAAANSIIDACYWHGEDPNKYLYIDSSAKYMLTCMMLIKLYTNLEYESDDILIVFNLLNENKVFDLLLECIDQRDLQEFKMVVDLIGKDVITNEYENHAYITKQVNRFIDLATNILPPFLEKLDLSKIQEIVDKAK